MDWGTLAWQIFWCLLLAFLLGFILGWLLNWLFGKDRYSKYEADLSARDNEIRGLKSKVAATTADDAEAAKLKTNFASLQTENSDLKERITKVESDATVSASLKEENEKLKSQIASLEGAGNDNLRAVQNENADLKQKIATLESDSKSKLSACEEQNDKLKAQISNLESDLSDSKVKLATAATLGAVGGSVTTAAVTTDSVSTADDGWDDDYGKIKARIDELEVLATDDEEDTDEDLTSWTVETESLQTKITALKSGANTNDRSLWHHDLEANAVSLLEILRKAKADKAAGIAKIRRQGYGKGVRDDLKEIEGVGPVLEKVLNGLDVWTFKQIAQWSLEKVAEVSTHLPSFKDRITREDWVGQSKELHFKYYGEKV